MMTRPTNNSNQHTFEIADFLLTGPVAAAKNRVARNISIAKSKDDVVAAPVCPKKMMAKPQTTKPITRKSTRRITPVKAFSTKTKIVSKKPHKKVSKHFATGRVALTTNDDSPEEYFDLPESYKTYCKTYTFPYKLYDLLMNAEKDGYDHIISFAKNEEEFEVHSHRKFEKQILPCYFGHANMRSMDRQLSYWGFKRTAPVQNNASGGVRWRHECLKKGRRDLLELLKREGGKPKLSLKNLKTPTPIRSAAAVLAPKRREETVAVVVTPARAKSHNLRPVPTASKTVPKASSKPLLKASSKPVPKASSKSTKSRTGKNKKVVANVVPRAVSPDGDNDKVMVHVPPPPPLTKLLFTASMDQNVGDETTADAPPPMPGLQFTDGMDQNVGEETTADAPPPMPELQFTDSLALALGPPPPPLLYTTSMSRRVSDASTVEEFALAEVSVYEEDDTIMPLMPMEEVEKESLERLQQATMWQPSNALTTYNNSVVEGETFDDIQFHMVDENTVDESDVDSLLSREDTMVDHGIMDLDREYSTLPFTPHDQPNADLEKYQCTDDIHPSFLHNEMMDHFDNLSTVQVQV